MRDCVRVKDRMRRVRGKKTLHFGVHIVTNTSNNVSWSVHLITRSSKPNFLSPPRTRGAQMRNQPKTFPTTTTTTHTHSIPGRKRGRREGKEMDFNEWLLLYSQHALPVWEVKGIDHVILLLHRSTCSLSIVCCALERYNEKTGFFCNCLWIFSRWLTIYRHVLFQSMTVHKCFFFLSV